MGLPAVADHEMSSIVLSNVVKSKYYADIVLPYLEEDYFVDATERSIAKAIIEFHKKYSAVPNTKEVVVELKNMSCIKHLDRNVVNDVLGDSFEITSQDWLKEQTEKFIRRRRVSKAFEQTYTNFENDDGVESISSIFEEAANFHFDNSIGHSYIDDAGSRWEQYTAVETRLSLMLEMLDMITDGGVLKGTLNCFLAGTGVGKSLLMCDLAAKQAIAGNKVLYLSMEMAELRISERIDSNLLDVPLRELKKLSKEEFTLRMDTVTKAMSAKGGDIIFKQYPTSSANAGHFRNLLIEIKNKKGYVPDVIYIDYLNICAPVRGNSGDNSYTKIKNIAEELRALAVEFDVPIITATQTNREGQSSTNLDFSDVSESHGLAATLDMLIGIISTEEWESTGKIMMCQIKNRYGDTNYYKRFMVGIDRTKMRLYNLKLEASETLNLQQTSKPSFGEGIDTGVLGGQTEQEPPKPKQSKLSPNVETTIFEKE